MIRIFSFRFVGLMALILLLAACSSTPAKKSSSIKGSLGDPIMVIAALHEQLDDWYGAPYHLGGMTKRGVDCSGFVSVTFKDRFALGLPRTTSEQARKGAKVTKSELQPGDLVFFRTGRGPNGLHVGIYADNDSFIHASTSSGVVKSSMNNQYWRQVYWQSRRL
ncbi:MAG: NlpC/P60 family protein [Plesiomonas sp.]|uniref:NlpC/P60 family protein n=2 Tax=Plesiomonas sp. TaxID=2486279 RepID=UPI003F2D568C